MTEDDPLLESAKPQESALLKMLRERARHDVVKARMLQRLQSFSVEGWKAYDAARRQLPSS